ncbi:radical SAM protein [Candidatus Sumerlaeota bacterium]|nr:radical SAM protein [Candidatus Sumerlaeota bacterium]
MKILFDPAEWKGLVRPVPFLKVLTIFITNRCNARCETCFYWQELNNQSQDLTLDEYRQIQAKLPPYQDILISGGEPTLAPHLPDVIETFIHRPEQAITMPTNGIKSRQIRDMVKDICERRPNNRFVVGVSLDAIGELHDRIRGVPGNYDKAIETLRLLCELKPEHPNLRLTSLTTVFDENHKQVPELLREMARLDYVDYLTVEPLRGAPMKQGLRAPLFYELRKIQDLLHELNVGLLSRKQPLEASTMLSHIRALHREQQRMLESGRLSIDCKAGTVIGVLEHDGQVRLCEMFEPVGNLRDFGYDFAAIWNSPAAEAQRRYIKTKECSCTHCVNIGQSLPFHFWPEFERLMEKRALERRVYIEREAAGVKSC